MKEQNTLAHKIIGWLKNPWHVAFLCILIVGIILRLKYFNINTGIWWDEGEYLLKAKDWGYGAPMEHYWSGRPIALTVLWALLFKLGANEVVLRFFTELLPSIGTVIVIYLLGKELYNQKVGVVAAAMMSVFWLHLFFTARLLMDLPGLFFAMMSILFFWKGFVKKQGNKYIYLTALFTVLTALTKYNDGMIVFAFIIILVLLERLNFLKNKAMWKAAGLVTVIILIPYMIFNYKSFGDPLPGLTTYVLSPVTSAIYQFDTPAYYIFHYFIEFLFTFWFIIFLVGLLTLWRFFISIDQLVKRKETRHVNDLLMILLIILPLIFFVFIYKVAVHQYLFLMMPAVFLLMAKATIEMSDFISKYNKYVGIVVIVAIVAIGGYVQLTHADAIIENKKASFAEIKEAGIWVKENTGPTENVMITNNEMEFAAYAERRYVNEGDNRSEFEQILVKEKPKYVILSLLFQNEEFEWIIPLLNTDRERFMPVQAWFGDQEKKQPRVVIYKVLKYETREA